MIQLELYKWELGLIEVYNTFWDFMTSETQSVNPIVKQAIQSINSEYAVKPYCEEIRT